jgi:hypothetical protein
MEVATQLVALLEEEGYSVWWDRNLLAGDDWLSQIQTKLDQARKVVVLWSAKAAKSKYVFNEAAYASSRKKLVPLAIEADAIPIEFAHIQAPRVTDIAGSKAAVLSAMGADTATGAEPPRRSAFRVRQTGLHSRRTAGQCPEVASKRSSPVHNRGEAYRRSATARPELRRAGACEQPGASDNSRPRMARFAEPAR